MGVKASDSCSWILSNPADHPGHLISRYKLFLVCSTVLVSGKGKASDVKPWFEHWPLLRLGRQLCLSHFYKPRCSQLQDERNIFFSLNQFVLKTTNDNIEKYLTNSESYTRWVITSLPKNFIICLLLTFFFQIRGRYWQVYVSTRLACQIPLEGQNLL